MRDRLKVNLLVWLGVGSIVLSFILYLFQPVGLVDVNPDDINYVLIGFEFGFSGLGAILLLIAWILHSSLGRPGPVRSFRAPASSDEEREKAEELYKERIQSALLVALEKKKDITPNEIVTAVEVTSFAKDDFCMVCKLSFKSDDQLLQCPVCESLYHKDHLLDWIRVHKNCPVCAQKIYDTVS